MGAGGRATFAGWADKALTPRGELQAKSVAARLQNEKLTAIYSSDLQRASVTAREIAAFHGLDVRVDARLREVNYGAWEGLSLSEILRDWPDEWAARNANMENVATPDGESYADLWRRLAPCWNEILRAHSSDLRANSLDENAQSDKTQSDAQVDSSDGEERIAEKHVAEERIAIVAHNGTLRLLLCHLLGMPPSNLKRLKMSNCGISRLQIEYSKSHAKSGFAGDSGESFGEREFEIVALSINETEHLKNVL